MQIREIPRVSCIRSYDAPSGNPDTALNYEWTILEAAMATCARHPYSPPLRIQDETEITKIIPCRDPSMTGHGNPIRMAAAEAECLFGNGDAKTRTTPIYISLGAGRPASEPFACASEKVHRILRYVYPDIILIDILASALMQRRASLQCFSQ